ncbi:hypothetical protein CDAR_213241 [Caerostris darwini]|uniref:Ribosomal protein L14 n=1 Tax=Caerostris darwini TaxID=1538125 RepID=A0AAV4PUH2_9ARAC|nr:hypothetical protein CDAR_213241 [Caerostris darwini]
MSLNAGVQNRISCFGLKEAPACIVRVGKIVTVISFFPDSTRGHPIGLKQALSFVNSPDVGEKHVQLFSFAKKGGRGANRSHFSRFRLEICFPKQLSTNAVAFRS